MHPRALLSWLAAVCVAPAAAHHSAAMFDTSKQVTIAGEITKFDWRNPHVYMAMPRDRRERRLSACKTSRPAQARFCLPLGLSPDAVAIGESVTIHGNPSRGGPGKIVLGRELVKADGSVLPLNIGSAASRAAPRRRARDLDRGHLVSAAARIWRLQRRSP